jgi:hypothetical protein
MEQATKELDRGESVSFEPLGGHSTEAFSLSRAEALKVR